MLRLASLVLLLWLGSAAATEDEGASPVPFGALNELLHNVQLIVPNMTLMNNALAHLVLEQDAYLQNISVEDATVATNVVSKTEIEMEVKLTEFRGVLQGPMGLRVPGGKNLKHGDGWFRARAKEVTMTLQFSSEDTKTEPPTGVKGKAHLKGLSLHMNCTGGLEFHAECDALDAILQLADSLGGIIENIILKVIVDKLIPGIDKLVKAIGAEILKAEHPVAPFPDPAIAEEANAEALLGTANLNSSTIRIAELLVNKVFNVNGTGPNANRLVINEVIDKIVPGGSLPVNTSGLAPIVVVEGPLTVQMQVNEVRLLGVDEFTDFTLLDVVANHTLQSELAFKGLKVALATTVTVEVADTVVVGGGKFSMGLDVNATLGGGVKLALITGVEGEKLMSIQQGSLQRSAMACIAEAVSVMNMTYLTFDPTRFAVDLEMHFVSPPVPNTGGLNHLLQSILEATYILYAPSASRALPVLTLEKLTPIVNKLLEGVVNDTAPCLPPSPSSSLSTSSDDGYVNFQNSGLIGILDFLMNEVFGDIGSDMDVNHVAKVLLETDGGWNGTAFNYPNTVSMVLDKVNYGATPQPVHIGYLALTIGNMSVSLLDGFSELVVLQPNGTHELDTRIRGPGVKVALDVNLTWTNYGDNIMDWSHIEFEIDELFLELDVAMLIKREEFAYLQLNQSLDLSCLYPTMGPHGLRFPVTKASVEHAHLSLDCYDCSGPVFYTWGEVLKKADPAIKKTVNYLLEGIVHVLNSEKGEAHIDQRQSEAVCGEAFPPAKKQYTKEFDGGWWFRFCIMFMLPLLSVLLMATYTAWRVRLALDPANENSASFLQEGSVAEEEYEVDDDVSTFAGGESRWDSLRMGESVACHPAVPKRFSQAFPVLVVCMATILLSAQMYYESIGIDASVVIGGQMKEISLYKYSTYKFCRDGFNAGGLMTWIALAIGGASGAWAWIRMFMLTWLFYVPPTVLSHKWRTHGLEFLDYTAKWSLIDPILNMFFIPMVNISLYPPDSWEGWTPNLLVANLFVDTLYGFFGFFLYQIVGLILVQVVLFYDRDVVASVRAEIRAEQVNIAKPSSSGRSVASGTSSVRSYATTTWLKEGAEDTRRESLRAHMHTQFDYFLSCFVHPDPGEKRSRISLPGRLLIFVCLVGVITVVIIGAVIPFVGVQNKGVLNVAIEVTPGAEAKRTYTLYEMMKLFVQAPDTTAASVLRGFVAIGIVICVVVVPILEIILLLGMWFVPLTLTEHKILFTLAEVSASWSTLDVFTAATFLITIAVHHLMSFITGNKFDGIDGTLNWLQEWGVVGHTSRVAAADGVWCSGLAFLAAGSVVSNVIYISLFAANKQAIRDREKIAYAVWSSRVRNANEDDEEDDHVAYDVKAKILQ